MTLNNIKVGSRLALAFGLILLIMAGISAIGVWRLQGLADTTHQLGTVDNEKLKMAVQWRQTIDLNWIRTRASIMDADTSRIPMWQADMDKTSEISTASRKRLIELIDSEQGKKLIAEIDAKREAYRTPRAAVLKRRQAGEDVTAVLERELKPLADSYSESIHKLEEFQQKIYDEALEKAEANAAQGRLILVTGSVLALLLGAAAAVVLTRSITGRIAPGRQQRAFYRRRRPDPADRKRGPGRSGRAAAGPEDHAGQPGGHRRQRAQRHRHHRDRLQPDRGRQP
jgi:methyl-accepting chemotaxis protein